MAGWPLGTVGAGAFWDLPQLLSDDFSAQQKIQQFINSVAFKADASNAAASATGAMSLEDLSDFSTKFNIVDLQDYQDQFKFQKLLDVEADFSSSEVGSYPQLNADKTKLEMSSGPPGGAAYHGARLTLSANFDFPESTERAVYLQTVGWDTDSFANAGGYFSIPTGFTGYYSISFSLKWFPDDDLYQVYGFPASNSKLRTDTSAPTDGGGTPIDCVTAWVQNTGSNQGEYAGLYLAKTSIQALSSGDNVWLTITIPHPPHANQNHRVSKDYRTWFAIQYLGPSA